MSNWANFVHHHQAITVLADTRAFLDSYQAPESPEAAKDAANRAHAVLVYAEQMLNAVDPIFIGPPFLNNLQKTLSSLAAELKTFDSDHNDNHLQAVHSQTDNLLNLLSRLPSPSDREKSKSLGEVISSIRTRAESELSTLRDKLATAESKVTEVRQEADRLRNDLDSTKQEAANQRSRIDSTVSELQNQFSQAEDRRRQEFDQRLRQFDEKLSGAVDHHDTELTQHLERRREESASVISTLVDKKKEAADLVQVIGNIGVTGNFQKVADAEKWAADWLRGAALLFMVLIIGGVTATVWVAVDPETAWQQTAVRLGITLALAVPATYAARESASHRRVERAVRRMELELASIDPYLETLPEDQKNEVKKQLSERFFGATSWSDPGKEKPVATQADVVNASGKELLDLVRRAIDQLARR